MVVPQFSYAEIQQLVDRFAEAASISTLLPEVGKKIAEQPLASGALETLCFQQLENLCNKILTESYNLPTDIRTEFAYSEEEKRSTLGITEDLGRRLKQRVPHVDFNIKTDLTFEDEVVDPTIRRAAVSDIRLDPNTKQSIANVQDFKNAAVEIIARIQSVLPQALESLQAQRPGLSALKDSDVNFTLRVQQAGQKHVSYRLAAEIPHLHPRN